ncbi:MAG: FAD-dependent oxidoreductase, partial [Dehalococcoidia bacterium]|nr:FAD-dependent oxidoreductase [Dehalococcoidia bacterium]
MANRHIGTETPLRVAVIGAGPAGFYASEALLKREDVRVEVDLFERLPAPYGLVRYGVAPDHQKIKRVAEVYDRIAELDGFRLRANVQVGVDVTHAELLRHYHQVLYAVGCEVSRTLGVPGEDLPGVYGATSFVNWYNGHPDFRDLEVKLDAERAVVVGIGDVAMDVTRLL